MNIRIEAGAIHACESDTFDVGDLTPRDKALRERHLNACEVLPLRFGRGSARAKPFVELDVLRIRDDFERRTHRSGSHRAPFAHDSPNQRSRSADASAR